MPPYRESMHTRIRSYIYRKFTRLEDELQSRAIIYIFLMFYAMLNGICALLAGAPTWHRSSGETPVLRVAFTLARGTGAVIDFNAAFVIIVASRNLLTFLRETCLGVYFPFDEMMPGLHSIMGNVICVAALFHTIGHIIRFSTLKLSNMGPFGDISLVMSGSLLLGALIVMRLTSLPEIRRRWFERFHWFHHFGFSMFYVILLWHGCHSGRPVSWFYITPALIIYMGDRFLQRFREHKVKLSISRLAGVVVTPGVLRLQMPRPFPFRAGQYCELKVPTVSKTQWHPFTIASAPQEAELTLYIKVNGDWTRQLCNMFSVQCRHDGDISIQVRGPHGAPAQHVGKYGHVVLISGGIGATPFCSVIKDSCNIMRSYMPGHRTPPNPGEGIYPGTIGPSGSVPPTSAISCPTDDNQ